MLHSLILHFWAFTCVYLHVTSTIYSHTKLEQFHYPANPPSISVGTYTQTGSVGEKNDIKCIL